MLYAVENGQVNVWKGKQMKDIVIEGINLIFIYSIFLIIKLKSIWQRYLIVDLGKSVYYMLWLQNGLIMMHNLGKTFTTIQRRLKMTRFFIEK